MIALVGIIFGQVFKVSAEPLELSLIMAVDRRRQRCPEHATSSGEASAPPPPCASSSSRGC